MKMVKKMTGNNFSIFFDAFVGEYVQIVTKLPIQIVSETQEGNVVQNDYLRMEGYLLDMDDRYYYLGETTDLVNQAVTISDVTTIFIAKTVLDGILDIIETPDDPKGFN